MKYCPICSQNYDNEVQVCEIDGATLIVGGKKDAYLGKRIKGRYQVLSKLGEGGMGTVYLADQMSVGRKVALKLLQGNYAMDDEFIGRFRREARLAASLNHRNIVTVYDFDQSDDGSLFIAMEYLDGEKLSEVIRRDGPLEISRAFRLGLQIAEGLEAAHRAGVIHRDIKPDNIMVMEEAGVEEIKLMDFGIARLRDRGTTSEITRTGTIMGTPAYMAPEQAEGADVSEKTDIYALGIVLYEMISGAVPFKASTPGAVLIKQMQETPLSLRRSRREVPVSIERIIMHALEKEPQRRQKNMGEVTQQLRAAQEKLKGEAVSRRWDILGRALKKTPKEESITAESPLERGSKTPKHNDLATVIEDIPNTVAATQPTTVYTPELQTRGAGWITGLPLNPPADAVKWAVLSLAALVLASIVIYKVTGSSTPFPSMDLDKKNLFRSASPQRSVEDQNERTEKLTTKGTQETPPGTIVGKVEKPVITVPPSQLVSLAVFSAKRELKINERLALRVKGQYSDGKEGEINKGVEWKSSDERIASVDSRGRVLARASGDVRLSANYQGLTSQAITLVVKDSPPPPGPQPSQPSEKPVVTKPDVENTLKLARLYYEDGKYSEAIAEANQVLKIDPDNKDARSLKTKAENAKARDR